MIDIFPLLSRAARTWALDETAAVTKDPRSPSSSISCILSLEGLGDGNMTGAQKGHSPPLRQRSEEAYVVQSK